MEDKTPMVRMGNALVLCKCGEKVRTNVIAKYMFEIVKGFQDSSEVTVRASSTKLQDYEAIFGMISRFNIKQLERKKVLIEGKEYIDILLGV